MRHSKLSDLKIATEALFQQKYQTLRPVLEAEARVQQQLARLDAQMRKARQDSAEAEGYQVTGTDVLWNGWESATRRQLNMELARLRAQKLEAIGALRGAFGRKQAVKNLAEALESDRKRAAGKKQSAP